MIISDPGIETGIETGIERSGISFNPVYALVPLAIVDLVVMIIFMAISSVLANSVDHAAATVWRVTDAGFCAAILYLTLASNGYNARVLVNSTSAIARLLLTAFLLIVAGWFALSWLEESKSYLWPWNGPLNFVGGGVLVMCLARVLACRVVQTLADQGRIARHIAVVGAGSHGVTIVRTLRRRKEPWTHVIGMFDDRVGRRTEHGEKYAVQGNVADLIAYARAHRVDDILVSLPWAAEHRLVGLLETLRVIPANVSLAPDTIGLRFDDRSFGRVDSIPVLNIFTKPIGEWDAMLKRTEDLVLGGVLLLVVTPILLCCAIAVRLDSPGPILFTQKRYGYNNKLIKVYKFRSMYHETTDRAAGTLVTRTDPRVTRVGGILRKTSLDELPQLLNVMRGDMSLVGPRPHATQAKAGGKLYAELVDEYAVRHKVKPGITGWAQVTGWRGETDTEEKILRRVEHDLYYMENWSLLFDIEILFRTMFALIGNNVY